VAFLPVPSSSLGHLEYSAYWDTERSRLGVSLKGDNYKIQLMVVFFSKGTIIQQDDAADKF
jgi:hypothetical protein